MRSLALMLLSLTLSVPILVAQTDVDIAVLRTKAEAGDVKAEVALARAYESGTGVPHDDARAFDLYLRAAKAGDPEAQNAVAFNYRSEKNFTESLKWYGLAAKQGNANAMFNLGTHYYNGDGVPIDDVQAASWFWLARKAGSKRAEDAVARGEHDLSPSQLSEVKLTVADMLAEGKAVPRDTATAMAVYQDAGRYGKPEVQVRIAKVFLNGWGVPEDAAKAETYCRTALDLEKNFLPAILCIAYLDQSGRLGDNRRKEAFSWYEKAYNSGSPLGAYGLGIAYANGDGTQKNYEKAFTYLVIASLSNVEVAIPLAKQLEQKFSPDTLKKLVKKANEEKKKKGIFDFGLLDRQFAYVVKVDRLP